MGSECFNGNNNDIEIPIKTPRENKINYKLRNKLLKDSQENSLKKLGKPLHYQTYFQNYENNMYRNEFSKTKRASQLMSNKSRSNSFKYSNFGRKKNIHNFTREELYDQVNDILRIKIPFFENGLLKTLSAFTFLSGNGPYHEGLMFFTTNKNFFIAQSYPITFIKVDDFFKGISEIISFNNFNKNSKKYVISEIYSPQEPITLYQVLTVIDDLPNRYNLINENCQDFCNNILEPLNSNFRIELNEQPYTEKINFLKKQKKLKEFAISNYKPIYGSGRFGSNDF